MPKALWRCFHFLHPLCLKWLLTPQLRKCNVEQGEETTLICFAWVHKQIVVGFVLEASLLNVGHQHGKNNFWKSSWLRKEIVSHVQGFTRPYKNKQGYLFWWTHGFKGREQPKSLQSQWQFQMSHIAVCPSAGVCCFTGPHLVSGRNA